VSGPLVSIIGPVGVGKTTLAGYLAEALPARLIEEDYRGNAFLADAYGGLEQARLPAQMFFLLSRAAQLDRRGPGGLAVSDYAFCQDAIFAARSLGGADLEAYARLAARVAPRVRSPDVLIHLDASEPTLLGRVARRGRPFERFLDAALLSYLRREYDRAVAAADCPVLAVDCEQCNLLDAAQRQVVLERLRGMLKGRE